MLAEWGEDRDVYIAENIFRVPPEARWTELEAQARQPTICQTADRAITAVKRDDSALKDVLPRTTRVSCWTSSVSDT